MKILQINSWQDIEKYFISLKDKEIKSSSDLEKWLQDRSELESVLEENLAWRYIKMTCDTTDNELSKSYEKFVTEIEPKINEYSDILNKKFIESEFLNKLDQKKYFTLIRSKKKEIEIFREKNIPIIAELQTIEQEYGKISGAMSVKYEGKEQTMQQAANYLKNTNREIREEVYRLINERRIKDVEKLNSIFTKLVEKRNKISENADYRDYRDYKFDAMGRFDYAPLDCFDFHKSIENTVNPLVNEILTEHKKKLKLDKLKPWDLAVDSNLKPPIKVFKSSEELIEKTIKCFSEIRPKYGEFISIMQKNGYLDLNSRKGKAPGGYNYPLYESNIPFIFMNATGNVRDLTTMVHEGGHAIHSFLAKDLQLVDFKSTPSEVAELASMSMELISMEHWDIFFDDKKELQRAKYQQLEDVIKVLPWIATVDKFQHWIYTNPTHSERDRTDYWIKVAKQFSSKIIDWETCEWYFANSWQKQLHIFEVPFYYIEYGFAQLGAIAIWKNYKENPEKTLNEYENALKLGYSKTIPEIYETAGIKFDFSEKYIGELMQFVKEEMDKLK